MLAGLPSASAQEPDAQVQSAYRDVVTHAVAEFDAQHYAEARSLFLRAHELWPSARTLRTLGMTSFELGNYPRALEELSAARDDARRALPEEQRAKVLVLIERTRGYVGRYRVQLTPPHAVLTVDGAARSERELVLAMGEHALLARAQGYRELQRALTVEGREEQTLALLLEPVPTWREPTLRYEYLAFGTGAAGLILSGVFSGLALRDKHTLDAGACPDMLCPASRRADVEQMQRFAHVATAGLAIGLLGAGVGSWFWFARRLERLHMSATGVRASF